jgi:hypothetical protein
MLCQPRSCSVVFRPGPGRLGTVNRSTSIFGVCSLAAPYDNKKIQPGQDVRLGKGSWQLALGEGFDFQIKIIKQASRELYHDWSLISPLPTTTATPPNHSGGAAPLTPTKNDDRQPASTLLTPGTTGHIRKRIIPDRLMNAERRPSPPRDRSPSHMLGETDKTHVFSATREGVTVAVKVCRKPTVKLSADM